MTLSNRSIAAHDASAMDAVPTSVASATATAPPAATEWPQRIHAGPALEAIYRLRVDALAADDVIFPDTQDGRFLDILDADSDAEQYAYLDAGMPVAAIRVSVHTSSASIPLPEPLQTSPDVSPLGYISRLVIHRDWRRIGLADRLSDFAIMRLKELGVKGILGFAAKPHLARFMESRGATIYRTALINWGQRPVLASGVFLRCSDASRHASAEVCASASSPPR
jgi:GNAT superfamily N-acetyltransferase